MFYMSFLCEYDLIIINSAEKSWFYMLFHTWVISFTTEMVNSKK